MPKLKAIRIDLLFDMKFLILTIFLFPVFAGLANAQQSFYGTDDVKIFRDGRDAEFRNASESPLLDEDFAAFKGLKYFPVDEKFRVRAKFTKTPDEKYFMMPTTNKPAKYIKTGILTFTIDGKQYALAVYKSEYADTNPEWKKKYGHAYFIPFKDLTNGKETYGGGRYIYLKIPEADETVLDFNLTFNPSCAYGRDRYSCPIPPKENFLQTEIKAGEKNFDYFGKKY